MNIILETESHFNLPTGFLDSTSRLRTAGDLHEQVWGYLQHQNNAWSEEMVWQEIRKILSECIPDVVIEEIQKESRLIQDLGAD